MANRFSIEKKLKIRYFDFTMLLTVAILLVFGLVMLYSVSTYDGSVNYGDPGFYLKKQAISTLLGLGVMFFVAFIPYHVFEKFAFAAYFASLLLIFLVMPFGTVRNGAKRWIYVMGISIQPAEIAKLAIILTIAYVTVRMGTQIATWKGFLITMGLSMPMVLAIYLVTSNLSSAIIVFGITFLMCFVASPDYMKFIVMGAGVIAAAAAIVYYIATHPDSSLGVRATRVLIWMDPEKYASGKGYQTLQALYAIGSGGIFGKGIGQSMQKLGYLPEAQNDMIFSIICEELGFFGGIIVIALFLLLIWRCVITANSANDMYGALLVVGFAGHIAIQVILNIAVVTNTIPNTGISLPFISYGGSSVVSLLFELGLVFSVQRSIKIRDYG